ncbi:MAG: YIP1 family protein [Erysipelotrichales bacterium]|nr:YIP1 family protein [Erysipelotrichales bacterium]
MEKRLDWRVAKTKSINLWQKFVENFIKFPIYLLTHPIKGFNQLKDGERGSLSVALIILLLAGFSQAMFVLHGSFIVVDFDPESFNSIWSILFVIVPILFFVIANWSVTTLMNGKGRLKEILMVLAYAQFPILIATVFNTFFSHMITIEEIGFANIIAFAGTTLMVYLALMGLLVVHEFGLGTLLLSLIFTIIALIVILFFCLAIFSLSQQIYGFVFTIIREIMIRTA